MCAAVPQETHHQSRAVVGGYERDAQTIHKKCFNHSGLSYLAVSFCSSENRFINSTQWMNEWMNERMNEWMNYVQPAWTYMTPQIHMRVQHYEPKSPKVENQLKQLSPSNLQTFTVYKIIHWQKQHLIKTSSTLLFPSFPTTTSTRQYHNQPNNRVRYL